MLFRQLFDRESCTYSYLIEEKQHHPRFVGRDRNNFIQFMAKLNLPQPQKIMEAVPANQQCARV